ncbi:hemolysin [Trinickia sp. LjRoot230]|uniref:hemolysin n=1 Tax=Trinickia sp. LjRoot230 TaxID=3342288 RepID=UPI003ED03100
MQHDRGSQSALTRSAVEAGSITITDEANQRQDVAMLNRDTSALSGTVARTPDLQSKLNRQAEVMTAVQEAGEVVAMQIGRYANGKREAALEEMRQAQARGDANLAAHYEAQAERWSEGGKGRALMQAAGAAVTVGLGGGNAVGAAAGAAVASLAGGKLDELAERIRSSKLTGNADVDEALGNIVANSLATVLGAAVGGNAGAGAYNADRLNRQLNVDKNPHRDEKTLAGQIAEHSDGKYTQVQVEDQMRIMGVMIHGEHQSGVPVTLVGEEPKDPGAQWIYVGTTSEGKPIRTQVTAPANPELQTYILEKYNSAGKDNVPSVFTYDRPNSNDWGFTLTGPFTELSKADVEFMRTTTADSMSMVSKMRGDWAR